jgi:nucleoid-associated protein YgaU
MRRDTQIGIILGIVILVIIGVFLSTRSSDDVTVLPDLVLSEGARQKTEVKEIDINSFFKESKKAEPVEEAAVENSKEEALVSEEHVESTQPEEQPEVTIVEPSNEDTSLEGKWEGVAEEIVEEAEIVEAVEIEEREVTVDEVKVTRNIPAEEEVVVTYEEPQTTSYSSSTDDVYYIVQQNDNLFKIARKHYGDGEEWNKIFEANRDSMPDSNSLFVGQELLIPDITAEVEANEVVLRPVSGRRDNESSSDVDTHTVQAGDTLYRIAEKYYEDPTEWTEILEANEDTIEDEGSLIKGQVLIIPKL